MRDPHPIDPAIDVNVWMDSCDKKNKIGKIYGVGPFASDYRKEDKILFTRILDGEGWARPPILTSIMAETIRQLALSETTREAVQKIEME